MRLILLVFGLVAAACPPVFAQKDGPAAPRIAAPPKPNAPPKPATAATTPGLIAVRIVVLKTAKPIVDTSGLTGTLADVNRELNTKYHESASAQIPHELDVVVMDNVATRFLFGHRKNILRSSGVNRTGQTRRTFQLENFGTGLKLTASRENDSIKLDFDFQRSMPVESLDPNAPPQRDSLQHKASIKLKDGHAALVHKIENADSANPKEQVVDNSQMQATYLIVAARRQEVGKPITMTVLQRDPTVRATRVAPTRLDPNNRGATMAAMLFKRFDTNSDGKLSAAEAKPVVRVFGDADTNKDGEFTTKELTDFLNKRNQGRGGAAGPGANRGAFGRAAGPARPARVRPPAPARPPADAPKDAATPAKR